MLEEKQKALDLVLKEIEKQYGKGAIMKLGQSSADIAIDVIPHGLSHAGLSPRNRRRSARKNYRDFRTRIFG